MTSSQPTVRRRAVTTLPPFPSLLLAFASLAPASCSSGSLGGGDASVRDDGGAEDGATRDAALDAGDALPPPMTGDPCDGPDDCGDDLVCADGRCAPNDGPCAGDEDCSGDTYCCRDECLTGGGEAACIPYGSGPRGDTNDACTGEITIGLFEPSAQCEWTGPPDGDAFPDHLNVLATPLVADLGNDSGTASEMVIVSYNFDDGGDESAVGIDPRYFGVIRVLDGQDCTQLESIHDPDNPIIAASPPAIGDLDGDGVPEIVTLRAGSGLVAFKWNPASGAHERFWASTESDISGVKRWDGVSIHDLNDDGRPEVISGSEVYDGVTGTRRNPGQLIPGATPSIVSGVIQVLADVDVDGAVELVAHDVWRWNDTASQWEMAYPGGEDGQHYAVADFGTPGATAAGFDPSSFDGIAEVVTVQSGRIRIWTLDGQEVLDGRIPDGGRGGPPTVGDFDNDGRPEVASAGAEAYAVFDFDCAAGAEPGCEAMGVRWSQPSQDGSSNRTGSSIFDFEGDGQAEAVYADECFTRIYEGATGEVLYSAFRTSCTWYENPVIADPDRDENTEILVGSNANCNIECPTVDPIHPGVRCEDGSDCSSGSCDEGLCRCGSASDCPDGNVCTTPLEGTAGAGNVCRAEHPPGVGLQGLRVLRDTLDRWVSSRPLWNQHAYSVTNVNDDGTIPSTSEWSANQNHADPALNNYRQNVQGERGSTDFPDITGRLSDQMVCRQEGEATELVSTVCNRGNRAVGSALPATFYLGDPEDGNVLCVSTTEGPVPVGGCLEVSCELSESIEDDVVTVVVNDDGEGGRRTVECNADNNSDAIELEECLLF